MDRVLLRAINIAVILVLCAGPDRLAAQPGLDGHGPASRKAAAGGMAEGAAGQAQANQALNRRLQYLEERMTDLQGAIGAFQSLAASSGSSGMAAPGGGFAPSSAMGAAGGPLGERVEVLETQIQALSGQIQQLTEAMARLQQGGGGLNPAAGAGRVQPQSWPSPPGQTGMQPGRPQGGWQEGAPVPFNPGKRFQGQTGATGTEFRTAALPPNPAAKAAFESAHNHIIRQDYAAAERAFRGFLQHYPRDPLASSARYWLGESHYMRGQYKKAAASFLAGIRHQKNGMRAPDTMLRLGMSLARLGQKGGACRTFAQLKQNYPGMAPHIRRQSDNEARRLGC